VRKFVEENNAGFFHIFQKGVKQSWVFASHPDTLKELLKQEELVQKDKTGFGVVGPLLAESLVTSNGDTWRVMRGIMSPAFHWDFLRLLAPVFVKCTDRLLEVWENKKSIDVRKDMMRFTMDVLGLSAFGIDFRASVEGSDGSSIHSYMKAYEEITSPANSKNLDKVKRSQEELSLLTDELIAAKLKEVRDPTKQEDVLSLLLKGQDQLTNAQLRDNILLLFVAGHDTTANALSWGLYYMAKYPEIQEKVRAEVRKILGDKVPDATNVKDLDYTEMFIKEVLRFRPPVANIGTRRAVADVQIGQYLIPKNTYIGLSIYSVHFLKEFWNEPEKFDPERFSVENSKGRHPFAYIPFSLGRRQCIGNNFSTLEQKIFYAILLQKYSVSISSDCVDAMLPIWQVCWPVALRLDVTRLPSA